MGKNTMWSMSLTIRHKNVKLSRMDVAARVAGLLRDLGKIDPRWSEWYRARNRMFDKPSDRLNPDDLNSIARHVRLRPFEDYRPIRPKSEEDAYELDLLMRSRGVNRDEYTYISFSHGGYCYLGEEDSWITRFDPTFFHQLPSSAWDQTFLAFAMHFDPIYVALHEGDTGLQRSSKGRGKYTPRLGRALYIERVVPVEGLKKDVAYAINPDFGGTYVRLYDDPQPPDLRDTMERNRLACEYLGLPFHPFVDKEEKGR